MHETYVLSAITWCGLQGVDVPFVWKRKLTTLLAVRFYSEQLKFNIRLLYYKFNIKLQLFATSGVHKTGRVHNEKREKMLPFLILLFLNPLISAAQGEHCISRSM